MTVTTPAQKPDNAAAKAEAEAKVKAEAKKKLETMKVRIKALKESPPTNASKAELETLERALPAAYHAADESYLSGETPKKGSEWLEKFKNLFDNKDGKGFSGIPIIGGLVGAVIGYFTGGIFGEGMLGSILKIVLPLAGAFFGAQAANSWFGGTGDSAGADGKSGGTSHAKGKTLQLSLEQLNQMQTQLKLRENKTTKDNYDGRFFSISDKPGLEEPNQPISLVSYDVLKRYIQQHNGGDQHRVVAVDIEAVLRATRTADLAHAPGTQAAAAVLNGVAAEATARSVTPHTHVAQDPFTPGAHMLRTAAPTAERSGWAHS